MNGQTLWKEVQMDNKYMNKCSTSLVIKKMQIKTILDSISPHSEWVSPGKQTITNTSRNVKEKEPLHTVDGNISLCSHYGNQYEDSSNKN
jgi:hypothetical protein